MSKFKTVSENLPFYPDMHGTEEQQKLPFECEILNEMELGDNPDPKERIPVYVAADVVTGEKKYIVQSYAVKKAVEAAKADIGTLSNVVFRFEFKGKTVVNGKPFNQFTTGYCTMQQFKEEVEPEVKKAAPKKK